MNNDYMNDEMEIDLIELLKAILCSIKFLFIITLISGATIFCISQFILQKSYISSTDITIMPAEQSLDYTSYLKSSKVLNKVSENVDIDPANLANSIIITRDSVNSFNYNITVTTNNPKLSYIIVKNIVEEFRIYKTR